MIRPTSSRDSGRRRPPAPGAAPSSAPGAGDGLSIGSALRLIRTRRQLTQTAAGRLDGAPDHRTISHWETGRKVPSLRLLARYLGALGLDFRALQEALDQVSGEADRKAEEISEKLAQISAAVEHMAGQVDAVDTLARRVDVLERQLSQAP